MRKSLIAGALIVAVMTCWACGKSEAQKQAEQAAEDAKKAAEAVSKAAEGAANAGAAAGQSAAELGKALGGMASALSGAAAAANGGKVVEPITFQSLQTMLPQVSGWEMGEPEGERMTSPVPYSQTEARYKKGDSQITVKIIDTGFSQLLVAPWSMMMAMGYSKESSSGYEKATMVGSNPGFEKWTKSSKNGELNVFVGKRFLLTIEGDEVPDTKVLHEFASKIDMGKLESLK